MFEIKSMNWILKSFSSQDVFALLVVSVFMDQSSTQDSTESNFDPYGKSVI